MHRLRTYIVEDSPVIRENLIATLEELGPLQVVGVAEDETTAVQWLAQSAGQIDLVIVDIVLGRGSGLGILRAAQQRPDHGRRIVVFSNYATPDMRHKCLALGADQVFDKSHDLEQLLQYCTRLAGDEAAPGGPDGHGVLS